MIETFAKNGRDLLDEQEPVTAHNNFRSWDHAVAEWLDKKYPGSGVSAEWSALPGSSLVMGSRYGDDLRAWGEFQRAVSDRLAWLSKLGRAGQRNVPARQAGSSPVPGKVFVVHGRNEAVRETVARFLERLRLGVVILHEQPNKGRTLIEKFVAYSDVAFAVVLLTGDDLGRLAAEPVGSDSPRARQNVILELGFFLGKLGRERVCPIHEEGIELPSDYDGVAFVKLDETGGWKLKLAKELKAAGLPVDLNDL